MIASGDNSTNRIIAYPCTLKRLWVMGDMGCCGLIPEYASPAPIRYTFNTTIKTKWGPITFCSHPSPSQFTVVNKPSIRQLKPREQSRLHCPRSGAVLALWPPENAKMATRWGTALAWKRGGSCLSMLGRSKQVVGIRPSSYPLGVCKRNAGTKQNKFVEVTCSSV